MEEIDSKTIEEKMQEYKNQILREARDINNQQPKHEVRYRNVNITSGIKFMRILGMVLYALSVIAIVLTFIVEYHSQYGGITLMFVCGGCLVPVSVGVIIRKVADIAEFLSEE